MAKIKKTILRRELNRLGMTSRDLSHKLNVADATVSRWNSGQFNPKPKHTKAMIDLGISEEAAIEPSKEWKIEE